MHFSSTNLREIYALITHRMKVRVRLCSRARALANSIGRLNAARVNNHTRRGEMYTRNMLEEVLHSAVLFISLRTARRTRREDGKTDEKWTATKRQSTHAELRRLLAMKRSQMRATCNMQSAGAMSANSYRNNKWDFGWVRCFIAHFGLLPRVSFVSTRRTGVFSRWSTQKSRAKRNINADMTPGPTTHTAHCQFDEKKRHLFIQRFCLQRESTGICCLIIKFLF